MVNDAWICSRAKPATSELPKPKVKAFDETNALISITRQERAAMIRELGVQYLFDQHLRNLTDACRKDCDWYARSSSEFNKVSRY